MKLIMQAPARWRMLCFKEAVHSLSREAVEASKTVEQGAPVGRLSTFRDLLCWELLPFKLSSLRHRRKLWARGEWPTVSAPVS